MRRSDPGIAAQIADALGDARTLINVGAGTGSYEPADRYVVAVEPSAQMRAKRSACAVPVIDATADALPFDDDSFDAALAVFTIHHWPQLETGLREIRRVCRGRIVMMTADPNALGQLWLADYSPEFHTVESRRYPPIDRIGEAINQPLEVRELVIAHDCADGFADAFLGRPERMLEREVRCAQSAWSFVSQEDQQRFVDRLSADLASGAWDAEHGHLRTAAHYVGSIRLLIAAPKP